MPNYNLFYPKLVSGTLHDYSQLSPCGHPAITDTPVIRTAAKSQAKINFRRLGKINSRYYRLLLLVTLTWGPYSVHYKEKRELTVSSMQSLTSSQHSPRSEAEPDISWGSLTSFRFDADSKHVFVGDYGGHISVIKLENNSPSLVTTLNGHSGKLPPWHIWFGTGD